MLFTTIESVLDSLVDALGPIGALIACVAGIGLAKKFLDKFTDKLIDKLVEKLVEKIVGKWYPKFKKFLLKKIKVLIGKLSRKGKIDEKKALKVVPVKVFIVKPKPIKKRRLYKKVLKKDINVGSPQKKG